ncbi:MAG: hypothetical protein H0X27_13435 [Caulobacteraceae bacterium]|nr:hypothetical protein [Caulobacteraceae bacterium]
MADRTFEMELDRLFAEAPAFADADLFALRVEERLDRGWTFRQFVIGGLGIAGGLIGGAQILGSGLLQRLGAATAQSNHLLASRLSGLHLLPDGSALDGEVMWLSVALAVVALGFAAARAIREI